MECTYSLYVIPLQLRTYCAWVHVLNHGLDERKHIMQIKYWLLLLLFIFQIWIAHGFNRFSNSIIVNVNGSHIEQCARSIVRNIIYMWHSVFTWLLRSDWAANNLQWVRVVYNYRFYQFFFSMRRVVLPGRLSENKLQLLSGLSQQTLLNWLLLPLDWSV